MLAYVRTCVSMRLRVTHVCVRGFVCVCVCVCVHACVGVCVRAGKRMVLRYRIVLRMCACMCSVPCMWSRALCIGEVIFPARYARLHPDVC